MPPSHQHFLVCVKISQSTIPFPGPEAVTKCHFLLEAPVLGDVSRSVIWITTKYRTDSKSNYNVSVQVSVTFALTINHHLSWAIKVEIRECILSQLQLSFKFLRLDCYIQSLTFMQLTLFSQGTNTRHVRKGVDPTLYYIYEHHCAQ